MAPDTPRARRITLPGAPPFDIHVHARFDRHVSEAILRHGCWEPVQTALTRALLAPGDTYVDVGANIGWFTLVAAAAVGPAGRVFAYEPEPENLAWLRFNVRRNRLAQVRVAGVAASDVAGEGWLYRSADNLGDHRLAAADDLGTPVPVELVRLDDHLLRVGGRLDLVKIDTQGAEPRVLGGFAERLARDRPALLVELWPYGLGRAGHRPADVLDVLRALGGTVHVVDDDGVRAAAWARLGAWCDNADDPARHLDLLWLPPGRPLPTLG